MRYGRSFAGLFYPCLCAGCGEDLVEGERYLCTHCRLDLVPAGFTAWTGHSVSALFEPFLPVAGAYAHFLYHKGGTAQQLIHRVKYRRQARLGVWLGELLGASLPPIPADGGPVVLVPVPLHIKRQRQRGYNQSELLCRGMSRVTGLPVEPRALKRVSATSSQTRRGRQDRWENTGKAFRLRKSLNDHTLVLVDDVITTGSTMQACAAAILEHGECRLYLASAAVAAEL